TLDSGRAEAREEADRSRTVRRTLSLGRSLSTPRDRAVSRTNGVAHRRAEPFQDRSQTLHLRGERVLEPVLVRTHQIAIQLRDAVGRLFAQQLGVLDRELETDVVHPALLRSHHPHLRAYAVSRPCQPRKWDAVRRCTPTRTQGTVLPAVARVC